MDILVGNTYWTPCDPGGPVELLIIEPDLYCRKRIAVVRYRKDHPNGHKAGEIGRYFADALRDPSNLREDLW